MELPGEGGATEPEGVLDACPCMMSAQLRPEEAPATPVRRGDPHQAAEGEAAFDHWLRQELSRLYDSALAEPVPEELLRLLRDAGPA